MIKRVVYTLLIALLLLPTATVQAQKSTKKPGITRSTTDTPVRNVILMIGDGMGLAHVTAAMLKNGAPLAIQHAQTIGLQTTRSASSEVTDSAAASTALATGTKTDNGMIGMTPDKQPLRSILERAEAQGLATGLIATYSITDATPAAFIAHNASRQKEYAIAEDFLKTDIDLFIGGGLKYFEKRDDGRHISDELRRKGYSVVYSLDSLTATDRGPIGVLLADKALPRVSQGRGNMLPRATTEALRLLPKESEHGFFIMIEGSQIDGAGHDNNADETLSEMLDFDAAVQVAMDFADRTPGTLVIVTGDHETGGMTLPANETKQEMGKTQPGDKNRTTIQFSTTGHTGSMVPIYAYGPGADRFGGVMDNTDIPKRIAEILGLR